MEYNKSLRYIIYARKSSESEDRQAQSIDDQIERLKALAKQLSLNVVDVVSEAKSAKQPSTRPIFATLLERIHSGEANAILCWHLNRLSRNPVDSGTIQWMLQRNIIQSIQTFDRAYKPDDNAILFSVESGSANQFIIELRKNTVRGMERRVDKGWMPNMAPLGYLNAKDDQEKGIIIPDPERFHLVQKIWELMLTGAYSAKKVCDLANKEWGFRTRKFKRGGNNPLSYSGVYRILNNQFYTGLISYKKQWHKGSHTPMVTMDEFDYVQRILGKKGSTRPQVREFAYTGLIRCKECGCLYTAETKTKQIKSTGSLKSYTYYHCTRKRRDIKCSQRTCIPEAKLQLQIEKELLQLTIDPDLGRWAIKHLAKEREKEALIATKIRKNQENISLDTERQLEELTRMRMRGLIDDEDFTKQRNLLKTELMNVHSKQQMHDDRKGRVTELTEKAFHFATYAHAHFVNGSLQEKREIMTALGSNRTIFNETLNVSLYPWFQKMHPTQMENMTKNERLEPPKDSSMNSKTDHLTTVGSTWLRGWGSNPRPRD